MARLHNLWTLSNMLSMSRVVMLIPIVYFLLQDGVASRWWAFFWIFLAMVTDNLDGRVARARNEVTEEGKILDPLADKICVGVVIVVLAWTGEIPIWFFALVVSRDVIILVGALYLKRKYRLVLGSNYVGKVAVTIIVVAMAIMILPVDLPPSLILTMQFASIAAIAASLLAYAKRFIQTIHP